MRDAHQRTRGVHDLVAASRDFRSTTFAGPVRREDHGFRHRLREVAFQSNTSGAEIGEDGLVVNKFAQNRDGSLGGDGAGQSNGVANAKALPQVLRSNKLHTQ